MDTSSSTSSSSSSSSSTNTNNAQPTIPLPASHPIPPPLSALLQLSGLLPDQSQPPRSLPHPELTIRIIAPSDNITDNNRNSSSSSSSSSSESQLVEPGSSGSPSIPAYSSDDEFSSSSSFSSSLSRQRYFMQNFTRFVEQFLPFSLLLVLVFIRQHPQGFCVALWIAVVLFKSNDVLRKQTALKGERKMAVLLVMVFVFLFHVVVIYWWYWSDGLVRSLIFVPPKSVPPFWHAVCVIMVNDSMVRLLGMAFKCVLLLYYKNSRGQNYRKQGQMLTLVEYTLLLYRVLLPTPVWYRFFLNKEYGSFFSALVTGLYLTFKLAVSLSQVQLFFAALRALSCKEIHYGSYATAEQVNAAGDLCAICQEKMQAPILLRCKHIFCEECVSEWFERERTCPLCRALVKPADIRSYSDGSTSLLFQLY